MNLPARALLRLLPLVPAVAAALLAACGGQGVAPDATYAIHLRFCSAASFSGCTSDPGNATLDEIPQDQRDAFVAAAARVQSFITAGLTPAVTKSGGRPLACDDQHGLSVTLDEEVHGLLLLVVVQSLPSYSTLASSGPCIERVSNHLPLVSLTEFNKDRMSQLENSDMLVTVITHEMLHTLGFGTVWADEQPPLISGAWTTSSVFTGRHARVAAVADNGAPSSWTAVPLEDCFGMVAAMTCRDPNAADYAPNGPTCCIGTRDSHWRETEFGAEIMTGYVDPSVNASRPLSATTLGSLQDLGYAVDLTKADAFSVTPPGLHALVSQPRLDLSGDVLRIPVGYADDGAKP